jgi:hypothetical protein
VARLGPNQQYRDARNTPRLDESGAVATSDTGTSMPDISRSRGRPGVCRRIPRSPQLFLDVDDGLGLLRSAPQTRLFLLELLLPRVRHLRLGPWFPRPQPQERAVLRLPLPRREQRGIQPRPPKQCSYVAWGFASVRLPQDPRPILQAEPAPLRLHRYLGVRICTILRPPSASRTIGMRGDAKKVVLNGVTPLSGCAGPNRRQVRCGHVWS